MFHKISPLPVLILLIIITWYLFYSSMPRNVEPEELPATEFSTLRAFEHVTQMSSQPHYVGSPAHSRVRNYIVNSLQEMGLEVQTQEGYVINNTGAVSFARNILARIPGTGVNRRSLLLMSHYDSAGHSSPGASDASSGVATILEGVRAFLANNPSSDNDIILLITDAEEIGLLGADLFTRAHPWAQNVGLALNFESRGSGGNSFMLPETNTGNAGLIQAFKNAAPRYPVTNSLAYSVYKMLPNDTDLTVLREEGNINGLNFAFIDDHFDYHTANDTPENLDWETLAHQGSYLMPLLMHFKDIDLTTLYTTRDVVYFSVPGGEIVSYPFSWIMPMLIIAFLLFIGVVMYGVVKRRILAVQVLKGSIPHLLAVAGSAVLLFLLWQLCLIIYPEYREMEHGFPYNGYWYIGAFIFLALTINFLIYHQFRDRIRQAGYFVFPIFFWLILCTLMAIFLKGAAYFIIPAFFAILQLWVMIRQERPNLFLMLFLSLPALVILMPFILTFPVALGLKILFVAGILSSLLFSLFIPVFGFFKLKKAMAVLCFLIFNILFITAHFKSTFTEERQKPNSLIYLIDSDSSKATWNTFDTLIDEWTAPYFGEVPEVITENDANFESKYRSTFNYSSPAPVIQIPGPGVVFEKTGIINAAENINRYSLKIAPNRRINRMELFAPRDVNFNEFTVNGKQADSVHLGDQAFHIFTKRWHNRLITYHPVNRDTLRLEFVIAGDLLPEFTLYESSYDLLDNEDLMVPARENYMIPRPFVVNDAIIVKRTIRIEEED